MRLKEIRPNAIWAADRKWTRLFRTGSDPACALVRLVLTLPAMKYGDHAAMRSARLLSGTLSNPELTAEMTGLMEIVRWSRMRTAILGVAAPAPRRAALASLLKDAVITNHADTCRRTSTRHPIRNSRLRTGAFTASTAVFSLLKVAY
jgi:hypothetical protein